MATAGGYGRNRNYDSSSSINRNSSPDDYSSRRSNNLYSQNTNNSYGSQQSTHPDNMTLDVVNEFKRTVQDKIQENQQINQPIIELEVAKIKRKMNPSRYDINNWKRQLPRDVQNCPDSILRVSMAYGDDPDRIKSVIQTKINEINQNENPTDTSLDNITEPLKRLQRELEDYPLKNIFHAVRNINGRHTDRTDRLFLSEAHHFAPGLKDYTFDDAHNAVQAIRESNYESDKPDDLIPIIKTLRDVEEIRGHLDKSSLETSTQGNKPNNNSDTSSYRYKPLGDPRQPSSQIPGRSPQGPNNQSRDEPSGRPFRYDSDRT